MNDELIRYLLQFMAGEQSLVDVSRYIGYTSDRSLFAAYKIIIVPSGFFDKNMYGTNKTSPQLPLPQIEGIPFLFGTPDVERVGDTIVVRADLVASAFFLLSRYEEILQRGLRDEHGRFPGRKSLPQRAGFIARPVVDEYGRLLRKWLSESGIPTSNTIPLIRQINLTHDVDAPFSGRTWRSVGRKIMSGINIARAIREKYTPIESDPYYTFPWMLKQDTILRQRVGEERCRLILFFKACSAARVREDRPLYDLRSPDMRRLLTLCRAYKAEIGLHSSYRAGLTPALIVAEKVRLEDAFELPVTQNRHHFLASREPEDMEYIEKAGITDDYTMGYADAAGFRLGTSRPVRYINPVTRRLSASLTLHPLTVMDCTLNETKYMNLTGDKAEAYCLNLINNIRCTNGCLTLLWHNTSLVDGRDYLRDLYIQLLNKI